MELVVAQVLVVLAVRQVLLVELLVTTLLTVVQLH
jgi:hypothetical protein